jgi:carbon monoxide dehydrogenase subunit G
MEQEVYVPFPAATVRRALADPERVAHSVPGLQLDAGEPVDGGTLRGRLRLRVAGSTITYRGTLRLTHHDEAIAVEGEGTEARGDGSVKLTLTVAPRPADGGTALVCSGAVRAEGRLAAVDAAQARAAGGRLLERFAEALTAGLETTPIEPPDDDNDRAIPGIPSPEGPQAEEKRSSDTRPPEKQSPEKQSPEKRSSKKPSSEKRSPEQTGGIFEAEVPPPSLDPGADEGLDVAGTDAGADAGTPRDEGLAGDVESDLDSELEERLDGATDDRPGGDLDGDLENGLGNGLENGLDRDLDDDLDAPPEAEAAHARRTMIGRSTEEVDHAPPRGRYAPVPPAEAVSSTDRLRWAAPAAALVVATAVVVSRALRRRR